jgi:uncharacterized membrane protein YqjE
MSLYSFQNRPEKQGFSELFRQLFDDIRDLFQQHVELTKTEVREGGRRVAKATIFGVIGLVLTQVTLIYLGSLLMLFLLGLTPLKILGATVAVFLTFLVLSAVCFGLVYREVKRMRSELTPPKS